MRFRRTAGEILYMVQQLRPNELDETLIIWWLSTIEHRVLYEILGKEDLESETSEERMLIGPPHDDVYWTHLLAMIDFACKDFESYKYSSAMAEKAWQECAKHYHHKKYPCCNS